MTVLIRLLWIFSHVPVLTPLKEMTMEEKRIENALFIMAGEEPPNDVPLNHMEETLHDMLVTSVKAVKESHVGRPPNETESEPVTPSPCSHSNENVESGLVSQPMNMWFHLGYNEIILFEFWTIDNKTGLTLSCVIVFIMGTLYEGLKWYRGYFAIHKRFMRKKSFHLPVIVTVADGRALKEDFKINAPLVNKSESAPSETKRTRPVSFVRLVQVLLYIIQLILAYFLMLIVMNYNIWLALAVILGAGFGNWLVIAFGGTNSSGKRANSSN